MTAPETASLSSLRWLPDTPDSLRSAAQLLIGAREDQVGAVVQDASGAIVGADRTAQRLLGLEWNQLVGLTSMDPRWQAVSEDGLPVAGDEHPAMVVLRTGRSVVGDVMGVLVPPDGSTAWLEITAHPLVTSTDPEATPQGVLALFADITATARGRTASDALIRAFRMLAENSSDVVLRFGLDGGCEWASPSVEHVTGLRPADLVGAQLLDFVHPDDRAALLRRTTEVFRANGDLKGVFRVRRTDGGYRWMSAVARLDEGTDVRRPAVVTALRDVHDQMLSTSRLAASERRHRLLAENSSDVVAHLRGYRLGWVSPSVRDALGYAPTDLLGRDMRALVHPEDRTVVVEIQNGATSGSSSRGRLRLTHREGSPVWFDAVGRPLVDDSGRPDGFVLQLRSLSAELEAARRAEELLRRESLTAPASRWELTQRMRAISSDPVQGGRQPAVGLCRVDGFTSLLDEFGEVWMRAMLDEVMQRITGCLRSGDIATRLPGDEIAVVLDNVRDLDDAREVFARIDHTLRAPWSGPAGEEVELRLTMGLRVAEASEDFRSLLLRADLASVPGETLGAMNSSS